MMSDFIRDNGRRGMFVLLALFLLLVYIYKRDMLGKAILTIIGVYVFAVFYTMISFVNFLLSKGGDKKDPK